MLQSSPIRRVQRPFQSSLPLTAVINRLLNPTAPALHLKCKLNTVLFTQRTLYKQKILCRWKENMQQQKKGAQLNQLVVIPLKYIWRINLNHGIIGMGRGKGITWILEGTSWNLRRIQGTRLRKRKKIYGKSACPPESNPDKPKRT